MNISKEYSSLKDEYLDFLSEIKRVIEKLLQRHNISTAFNISGRLKELNSIEEKNSSKRYVLKETITELNDLVGLRIVLLFPEFKENVISLLTAEFQQIQKYKSSDQIVDKFGYSSAHLILGVKDEWLQTPDWKEHANKKIEIQIRTLSEHIWAETSHSLFYKREENIPKVITRNLYRLSALLEVVDEKLQDIKHNVTKHFDHIKNCSYEEILKLDLNSETFRRVMQENSKGLYDFNDYKNRELSAKIEHDYDLHNTVALDNIIKEKVELKDTNSDTFVNSVIELLEADKINFEKKQKE